MRPLRCLVGFHEWRHCRCNRFGCSARRDQSHYLGPWASGGSLTCTETRSCLINGCSVTQQRACHKWGDWRYVNAGSCEQERCCERCASQMETQVFHAGWLNGKCERCGDAEVKGPCP